MCIAAVCGLLGPTSPSAADDEEQRAAAASATSSPSGAGTTVQWGDFTVKSDPYIETEAGSDSNPDNSFSEDGSGVVKMEAGIRTTFERQNEFYAFSLKGRYLDFRDLEEDPDRHDLKAAFEAQYKLSDTSTLNAGSYYLRDMISVAKADIYHSYVDYGLRTDTYRIKLLGKNHTEHNLNDDIRANGQSFDDFLVSRASSFDYARSDGQVSALTFTQSVIQPYIIADFGQIDYYNQDGRASINRDATEAYGIAGLRFQLNKDFRVDTGYRLNNRQFQDRTTADKTTDFLDLNVFWQPRADLKFNGVVERYFDESTSSRGLVDDVKSYGLTVDWDITPRTRFFGTTYYDQETAIGDSLVYDKITSTVALTHDYSEHVELFVSGLAKWVDETVSEDHFERYKLGSGVRLKF